MPGVDLSRTVGWFTSDVPGAARPGPGDREHRGQAGQGAAARPLPDNGIGYGLLRDRLAGPAPQRAVQLPRPVRPGDDGLADPARPARHGPTRMPLGHLLEINALVRDGAFTRPRSPGRRALDDDDVDRVRAPVARRADRAGRVWTVAATRRRTSRWSR